MISVILVDDNSGDGTEEAAERTAASWGPGPRFVAIRGRGLPPGWTGKLWAVSQGQQRCRNDRDCFFTDADIAHAAVLCVVAACPGCSFVL